MRVAQFADHGSPAVTGAGDHHVPTVVRLVGPVGGHAGTPDHPNPWTRRGLPALHLAAPPVPDSEQRQ